MGADAFLVQALLTNEVGELPLMARVCRKALMLDFDACSADRPLKRRRLHNRPIEDFVVYKPDTPGGHSSLARMVFHIVMFLFIVCLFGIFHFAAVVFQSAGAGSRDQELLEGA